MKQINVLIKPASALCNMRCRYCFYFDVISHWENHKSKLMSIDTAYVLIDKVFDEGTETNINFSFQGGEPLIVGLDFYRNFVSYVNEHKNGQTISFSLQTNGTLLNEDFARFFQEHNFLLGVSIDGPEFIHDKMRFDVNRNGTYDKIMSNIRMLQKMGVTSNILTVINSYSYQYPNELYEFYQEHNLFDVQLIPCLPDIGFEEDQYSLTPEMFFDFYKTLFNRWLNDVSNGQNLSIALFDDLILMLNNQYPRQCGMLGKCSPQLIVESNGEVFPCDFFVLEKYKLGDIHNNSVSELLTKSIMQEFIKEPKRPSKFCDDCPFVSICHGNCKRLNVCYYNEKICGYRDFLEVAIPQLQFVTKG